jgi:hypothetical protein
LERSRPAFLLKVIQNDTYCTPMECLESK